MPPCSLLLANISMQAQRHPKIPPTGLKSLLFLCKSPRTMGRGVPRRALVHATSPQAGHFLSCSPTLSCPLLTSSQGDVSHTGVTTTRYSFPEKDPNRSAP